MATTIHAYESNETNSNDRHIGRYPFWKMRRNTTWLNDEKSVTVTTTRTICYFKPLHPAYMHHFAHELLHGQTHTCDHAERKHIGTHTHTQTFTRSGHNGSTQWDLWRKYPKSNSNPFAATASFSQPSSVWLFVCSQHFSLLKVKLIFLQHLRVSTFVPVELLTRAYETLVLITENLENIILNSKLNFNWKWFFITVFSI